MKKAFLTILLALFFAFSTNAQTVVSKTKAQTEQSLTKTATKTTYVYLTLPVWKSSKGSLFVVRQSKKTGNFYKEYVTLKK